MPVRAAVYSGQRGAQFRAAAKAHVQTAGASAGTARNLHSV